MGRVAKINANLDELTEDEFYKAVKLILSLLTTNILLYPGLTTLPAALKLLIQTFDDTRTSPFYVGIGADIAAARTAVQTVITTNGRWLNTFCKGNLPLLTKTGYPLEKESEAQGKLEATILTLLALSLAGCIEFFISHITGKGIKYGIKYTLATNPETNPAKWEGFFYAAGQREGVITDLESKKDYKFSSFAMGTDRDITYSVQLILSAQ